MKVIKHGSTLTITDLGELSARTWKSFEQELETFVPGDLREIEIDFSHTVLVDCRGIGALLSVLTRASNSLSAPSLTCIHPTNQLKRLLNLAGLDLACRTSPGTHASQCITRARVTHAAGLGPEERNPSVPASITQLSPSLELRATHQSMS